MSEVSLRWRSNSIDKRGTVGPEERIRLVDDGLLPILVEIGREGQRATLADRMRFYRVPGVSIAVINDDEIELAQGYGATETSGGMPVTPKTLFQAASISKPVAAAAALRLIQEERLALDSDVNTWLTS